MCSHFILLVRHTLVNRLTAVALVTVVVAIVVVVTHKTLRNAPAVVTCEFVVTARRTCGTQSTTAPKYYVILLQFTNALLDSEATASKI